MTVEAETLVELFFTCYGLEAVGFGGLAYRRRSLPVAGGAADQPAKTMAAFAVIEAAANQDLQDRHERSPAMKKRPKRHG